MRHAEYLVRLLASPQLHHIRAIQAFGSRPAPDQRPTNRRQPSRVVARSRTPPRLVGLEQMPRSLVWTLYGLLVLIWSSTWLAIKVGLEDVPPLLSAGVRF